MNRNELLDTLAQVTQPNHEDGPHSVIPFPCAAFKQKKKIHHYHSTFTAEERKKHGAFHEAGHAAAMYLNTKNRNLPPIFFQIKNRQEDNSIDPDHRAIQGGHTVSIEGGRLIHSLPLSIEGLTYKKNDSTGATEQLISDYMFAVETDIINLLIGPLAEARYVHDDDNEPLTRYLLTTEAFEYYSGDPDLILVHEYLQKLFSKKSQQDKKLQALFTLAFDFIMNCKNWTAINRLAEYLLTASQPVITYQEVVTVLDSTPPPLRKKTGKLAVENTK